jgi:tetratricopeptide (TPR) repeat protein
MSKFDWRTVVFQDGVLREPTPDDKSVVFWLPGQVEAGYQHWERIANVVGADVDVEGGIGSTAATAMPARQPIRSLLGKVWQWLQKPAGQSSWLLPTGAYAEQTGERRSGIQLVWAVDGGVLDESRLAARWDMSRQTRKVGPGVFVIYPTQPGFVTHTAVPNLRGNPRELAEKLLAAARQAGDRRAESIALTDLGIACLRSGDNQQAQEILEQAAALGRKVPDRTLEQDALANLGVAMAAAGQPARALELLDQALGSIRDSGDRFAEKLALANRAAVLAGMRDFTGALAGAGQAMSLARELGDRHHEADILWFQAVQHAERGEQDEAWKMAQAAIDVHAALRSPHVAVLKSHLKRYRPTVVRPAVTAAVATPTSYYTGPTVAVGPRATPSAVAAPPAAPIEKSAANDPGILRTAVSIAKALEASAGSNLKTVTPERHRQRLEICGACPHHTGVRCKLCGNFTVTKAWLPHETCPAGKWTS